MLQKYKEIVYGIAFGLGAVFIDAFMDAHMEGHAFWTELVERRPMLLYRLLFLLYGFAFGWLLWQRNSRERDFRTLADAFKRLRLESGKIAVLMHSRLQLLMTRDDLHLSREAGEMVGFTYERSRELQSILNETPPLSE